MYSYDITELLISGYIRWNHNDFVMELSRICMNYYWLRLPKFKLNQDHTNNFNLDYRNAEISCSLPATYQDPYDCLWSDDAQKCIRGTSTVLWQKSDAMKAPKTENSDNAFKFAIKCTRNFNSFGVGIVSESNNIKYLLWIEARSNLDKEKICDSYLQFTKQHHIYDNETNNIPIQLSEYGDSLSVILNYDKDVAEFYHNDIVIICINIEDKSFYPIFYFLPNRYSQINDIPFKTSTFEITSCHLCRLNKDRIFNESMVTIKKYKNLLSYSVLQTEADEYNSIYLNSWSDVKHDCFDLLWKGYNLLNLEQFDDKLSNVIDQLRDTKIAQRNIGYEMWHYSYKKRYESLMINLWILIEMFKHFRKQYIELIYDAISINKVNNSNYNSVAIIITDYIIQNFDEDYQNCFASDHDYLTRLSKIYMDLGCGCSGDPIPKYTNQWFDENVLPKLSFVPKDVWITHTWTPCCPYYWKYYYHTKETIIYKPGVLAYNGEDYHDPDQTDWQHNQLMISHELSQLLVTGYIREILNGQQNYKHLATDDIPIHCLNYYFLCVPNFSYNKIKYPIYRPKEEECKEQIKIDIDYKDGIVTYKHDGKNEIDNNYKWANNVFEGIWKQIKCKEFDKKYVHKFEMQSIQNVCSFIIGITKYEDSPYKKTYCISIEQQQNNSILSVNEIKLRWYNRNDPTDIEQEIAKMVINKTKIGDKLGLILDYDKSQVTFYYNDAKFISVDLGQYVEVIPTHHGDDYINYKGFYHPIFSFKTNDINTNQLEYSKYKILSCHLETDQTDVIEKYITLKCEFCGSVFNWDSIITCKCGLHLCPHCRFNKCCMCRGYCCKQCVENHHGSLCLECWNQPRSYDQICNLCGEGLTHCECEKYTDQLNKYDHHSIYKKTIKAYNVL